MPRYEFSEGTSNKFWEIELSGTSYTAKWGKIGGSTSMSTKDCGSPAAVQKAYDKLIAEKTELRNAELAAAERHFERLREGQPETQETTSLHLDVLRDLKRIHSHICSVAYPVLEAAGEIAAVDVGASDPITLAAPGAKPAVQ